MPDLSIMDFLTAKFLIGVFLFIRLSGLMVAGPFFRSEAIPPQVKIFLSIVIAASLAGSFMESQPPIDFHLWNIVLIVFKEFFVGVAIGYSANMIFQAARFAGGMVDFNMSYNTSALFSQEETTPTLVGELYDFMAVMIFLIINGHHYLIESVYASVRAVPVTTFEVTGSTVDIIMKLIVSVFIIAIKISAPILVSIFLTNLALALLSRIAPQTNIFILSFQLKIAVGLIILLLSVPLLVMVIKGALESMETETMKLILSLNPKRV